MENQGKENENTPSTPKDGMDAETQKKTSDSPITISDDDETPSEVDLYSDQELKLTLRPPPSLFKFKKSPQKTKSETQLQQPQPASAHHKPKEEIPLISLESDSDHEDRALKKRKCIDQIESHVQKKLKEISDYEQEEVDLADPKSSYIKIRTESERSFKAVEMIYGYGANDCSTSTGRCADRFVRLPTPKAHEFLLHPKIKNSVERFLNSRRTSFTPTYREIYKVVTKSIQKHSLQIQSDGPDSLAKQVFRHAVESIRALRVLDTEWYLNKYLENPGNDSPEAFDQELNDKLEKNRKECSQNEELIINKFTKKQEELIEMGILDEDSSDGSSSDSSSDDDEMDDNVATVDEEIKDPIIPDNDGESFSNLSHGQDDQSQSPPNDDNENMDN